MLSAFNMDLSRHVTQRPLPPERKVTATSTFVGPITLLALEAAAGSSAGLATDSIFYGLDSYKVQKQQPGGHVNVRNLFRGLLPLSMMGTVPSFGVFFLVYEPCKRALAEVYGVGDSASVALASLVAGVPASLVYVPADTVKKVHVPLSLGASKHSPNDAWKAFSVCVWRRGMLTPCATPFVTLLWHLNSRLSFLIAGPFQLCSASFWASPTGRVRRCSKQWRRTAAPCAGSWWGGKPTSPETCPSRSSS
jgi:hypothetical protein